MRLEILKAFTVILKIPATIKTYKVIPMWLDLSHIAQNKLTAVQMLAILHNYRPRLSSNLLNHIYKKAIFIPIVFLCQQAPQGL